MNAIVLLTTNAALLVALFVLLWLVCLKTRDVTPIDSVWALGMVFLAAASFLHTGGNPTRKALLLGLCALWGVRLGLYLLWRWSLALFASLSLLNSFAVVQRFKVL